MYIKCKNIVPANDYDNDDNIGTNKITKVYHIELQERLQFIRTPILFHFIVLGVALSQFVCYICLKVPKRKKGEKRPMGIWSYFHGTHSLSRLLSSCSQQKQSSFNTNHAEGPPSWVRSAYRRLGSIQEPGETCC